MARFDALTICIRVYVYHFWTNYRSIDLRDSKVAPSEVCDDDEGGSKHSKGNTFSNKTFLIL